MIKWFLNFFEKNYFFSWLITVIIAVLIFYISSLTFPAGRGTGFLSYIYHFTAFSYLTLFLLMSITRGQNSKKFIFLIMGVILVLIYGILDEIHQYFVPGRSFAIKDILINSFGILVTSIAYINYCRIKK